MMSDFNHGKPVVLQEKGATMIEYALMIALIAVVAMVAITNIGQAANEAFKKVGNTLNTSNN